MALQTDEIKAFAIRIADVFTVPMPEIGQHVARRLIPYGVAEQLAHIIADMIAASESNR